MLACPQAGIVFRKSAEITDYTCKTAGKHFITVGNDHDKCPL